MQDVDILKKVAEQELAAEKRYAAQVSKLCDGEIKEILVELKEEELRHKRECVVIIKSHEPSFDSEQYDSDIDMELNTVICASLPDIIAFLELDLEKEMEAKKLYEGYAQEVKDEKIANMLKNFVEDEAEHFAKIHKVVTKYTSEKQ
jgi:rubrerythrin